MACQVLGARTNCRTASGGDIRKSFWNADAAEPCFTLGDFGTLAGFCALSQAIDVRPTEAVTGNPAPAEGSGEVKQPAELPL